MSAHLRHAAGAHLELLRAGLLAARETAASFRRDAEAHGDVVSRAAERRRAEALAALAASPVASAAGKVNSMFAVMPSRSAKR